MRRGSIGDIHHLENSVQTLSGRFAAILIAAASLWCAGCQSASVTAAERAKLFVHTLVAQPDDTAVLNSLAGDNAQTIKKALFADVSTRITLAYLQARYRQGVALTVRTETEPGAGPARATVLVHVRPADATKDALVLRVALAKTGITKWTVSNATPVDTTPPAATPKR